MATVSFKTKRGVVRFQTKAKGASRAGKRSAKGKRPTKGKTPAHLRKYLFTSRTARLASKKARRSNRR